MKQRVRTLAVGITLVQLFDGIVGMLLRDPGLSCGTLVFAAVNFGLLLRMQSRTGQAAEGSAGPRPQIGI